MTFFVSQIQVFSLLSIKGYGSVRIQNISVKISHHEKMISKTTAGFAVVVSFLFPKTPSRSVFLGLV